MDSVSTIDYVVTVTAIAMDGTFKALLGGVEPKMITIYLFDDGRGGVVEKSPDEVQTIIKNDATSLFSIADNTTVDDNATVKALYNNGFKAGFRFAIGLPPMTDTTKLDPFLTLAENSQTKFKLSFSQMRVVSFATNPNQKYTWWANFSQKVDAPCYIEYTANLENRNGSTDYGAFGLKPAVSKQLYNISDSAFSAQQLLYYFVCLAVQSGVYTTIHFDNIAGSIVHDYLPSILKSNNATMGPSYLGFSPATQTDSDSQLAPKGLATMVSAYSNKVPLFLFACNTQGQTNAPGIVDIASTFVQPSQTRAIAGVLAISRRGLRALVTKQVTSYVSLACTAIQVHPAGLSTKGTPTYHWTLQSPNQPTVDEQGVNRFMHAAWRSAPDPAKGDGSGTAQGSLALSSAVDALVYGRDDKIVFELRATFNIDVTEGTKSAKAALIDTFYSTEHTLVVDLYGNLSSQATETFTEHGDSTGGGAVQWWAQFPDLYADVQKWYQGWFQQLRKPDIGPYQLPGGNDLVYFNPTFAGHSGVYSNDAQDLYIPFNSPDPGLNWDKPASGLSKIKWMADFQLPKKWPPSSS